jgi:uncharacterized Zn-binding protein involved in type VI secretion
MSRRAMMTRIMLVTAAVVVACAMPRRLPAEEMLAPGVRYRLLVEKQEPQVIHVLEIDRDAAGIEVVSSVGAAVRGSETVAQMARLLPDERGTVLAAVNGDFFQMGGGPYPGTVQGTTIIDGELVTGPGGGHAFCLDRQGRPAIVPAGARFELSWPDGTKTPFRVNSATTDFRSDVGSADVVLFTPRFDASTQTEAGRELLLAPTPDSPPLPLRVGQVYALKVAEVSPGVDTPIAPGSLVLSLATKAAAAAPALRAGDTLQVSTAPEAACAACTTAISGDPVLLVEGQIKPAADKGPPARAPRTVVGYGVDRIFLVVAEGRQPGRALGLSHREMAERLLELGCTDAVNLDGGGSATMMVAGQSKTPRDARQQRPVGNALLVVRRPSPREGSGHTSEDARK